MPKFSRDREALLKTLKRFDGDIKLDDVTDAEESQNESSNHTFLLHVLLEALCGTMERDSERRLQLFNGVYSFLSKSNVLDEKIVLDNLLPTRRKMAFKLLNVVTEIHKTVVPNPKQDLQYLDFIKTSDFEKYQDKYKQTFEEIKVIAEGGFGTVFMAKHKFDGIIYAVKKIIFKLRNDSEYSKVIREVRSISTLNHLNVVSYNNAWIEEKTSQSELSSEASSSTEGSELGSLNSSSNSSKKKPKCANTLQFSACASGSTSHKRSFQSKQSEFSEEVLFSNVEDPSSGQTLFSDKLQNKFFQSSRLSDMSERTEWSSSNSEANFFQWNFSDICCKTPKEGGDFLPSLSNLSFMCPKVILCIQMEYCDCDLRLWLDQRAKEDPLPFHIDEVDIFKNILNGVAHIHSKSIIHRDLKPQNIFYSTKDNVMKIGDFGLATLGSSSPNRQKDFSTHHSSDLGTLPYAAPEQRHGHDYNNKVDIYSLGIILIELLLRFQTQMEFCKTIDNISKGDIPNELLANWPNYLSVKKSNNKLRSSHLVLLTLRQPNIVFLVEKLIKKNPNSRMSAKDILNLPLIQGKDNHEDMKETVQALKRAIKTKDWLIGKLRKQVNEQKIIINQQREQIELCCKNSS